MSERDAAMMRVEKPEASRTISEWADAKLRENLAVYDQFRTKVDEWRELAQPYLDDPAISEGTKAAIRSFINTGIAIGDMFPGYGLAVSGGADLAKTIARAEYRAKRAYVKWVEGGDPNAVKMSVLDLTPDVKLRTALGSELLELCFAGFLPSHAIEGGIQLWKDVPRMRKAYERIRAIAAAQAEVSEQEREAARVFDVDFEDVTERYEP